MKGAADCQTIQAGNIATRRVPTALRILCAPSSPLQTALDAHGSLQNRAVGAQAVSTSTMCQARARTYVHVGRAISTLTRRVPFQTQRGARSSPFDALRCPVRVAETHQRILPLDLYHTHSRPYPCSPGLCARLIFESGSSLPHIPAELRLIVPIPGNGQAQFRHRRRCTPEGLQALVRLSNVMFALAISEPG